MNNEVIKIYYEELPKRKGGKIDWNKSLNCNVKFQCIDIIGEFKIVKIDRENNNITHIHIQYNDSIFILRYGSFLKSKIKTIFYPFKFNYTVGQRIVDNKKDFTITELKTRFQKKYNRHVKVCSYHCNKCLYDGEMDENKIESSGCPCCGTNSYVVVPGVNDICTTDPWMIPYFQGGEEEAKLYSSGSDKKIYPICPDCGRVKDHKMNISKIHKQHSIGCKCSDGISYPEKFFISFLDQLNINYIYQLSKNDFDWCQNFRYDFYLIDYNYIIELHGEQHYKEVKFLTEKGKPSQVIIDNIKRENALKHINKYIEINCSKSEMNWMINNIEKSILSNIFDLSTINYKKCEEFACKNIIKEICEYYRDNNYIQIKDLSEKYNLSYSTIIRYLHKGHDIGWCTYNIKHNKEKQCKNLKKINSIYVEIYKNDILIKSYNSLQDADLNTLNDLGIKLVASSISQHYKNNKPYHGYMFKLYKNGILL